MKIFAVVFFVIPSYLFAQSDIPFSWPQNIKAAVSLSFDDGRHSQVEGGTALLDSMNVKATFYVVPRAVKAKMEGWQKAVRSGHEIGNHSLYHPCSGNFAWSREHALENYTLGNMRNELSLANDSIQQYLGVTPTVFAYPCGQKFIGRGTDTQSYVPLIAEMFLTGRGFMEETPNDPAFTDFAQITGIVMDGKDFEEILPLLEQAKESGQWVVLAGHEMAEGGAQTTKLSMLGKLIACCQNPSNNVWIAPVGTVAGYIKKHR